MLCPYASRHPWRPLVLQFFQILELQLAMNSVHISQCVYTRRLFDMPGNDPDHLPTLQVPTPLLEPTDDRAQLYDILTRASLQGLNGHLSTELVQELASANHIHRFES